MAPRPCRLRIQFQKEAPIVSREILLPWSPIDGTRMGVLHIAWLYPRQIGLFRVIGSVVSLFLFLFKNAPNPQLVRRGPYTLISSLKELRVSYC
jgi:hypothetical protein